MSIDQLFMPMAFAAQLGGVLTLIGTPPNLVASQALTEATGEGLGFFSLTPYGLLGLAAGVALMTWAGRWLLPPAREKSELADEPSIRELAELFGIARRVVVCEVPGFVAVRRSDRRRGRCPTIQTPTTGC